jgi:hypothetical protein
LKQEEKEKKVLKLGDSKRKGDRWWYTIGFFKSW